MWAGLIPTISIFPGHALPTGLIGITLLLPCALWGRFKVGLPHLFIGLFLAYAATSALWAHQSWWYGLWILSCFLVGLLISAKMNQRRVWIGIGCGLSLSSLVATAQWLGLNWPQTWMGIPAGLYLNQSLHGWILSLAVVGLVCNRLWPLALPLIPGLILSQSRAAVGLIAVGLIATVIRKPLVILTLCLALASMVLSSPYINDVQRIEIWRYAIDLWTPLGNGVGSFMELWYHDVNRFWFPYFAHNDYIQLVFEFGIGSVPLFLTWFWLALQSQHPLWPLHISCLLLACFAFPFYTPITAFIWALACGGIMRNSHGNT